LLSLSFPPRTSLLSLPSLPSLLSLPSLPSLLSLSRPSRDSRLSRTSLLSRSLLSDLSFDQSFRFLGDVVTKDGKELPFAGGPNCPGPLGGSRISRNCGSRSERAGD